MRAVFLLNFVASMLISSLLEISIEVVRKKRQADSFFENCSYYINPIFVGLYVEEIKNLTLSDKQSIFLNDQPSEPKVVGFFPSQFDPIQTTVLVLPNFKSPLYWKLFTNRRRNVKFDILYSPYAPTYFNKNNRYIVPEHLERNETNHYVSKAYNDYKKTDLRGGYLENTIVRCGSYLDLQGCVLYKCFFLNSYVPVGTLALEPIHMNYDLVLQEAAFGG